MALKHVVAGLTAGLVLATAGAALADHGQQQGGDHTARGTGVTASVTAGALLPPGQAAHGVQVWTHGKATAAHAKGPGDAGQERQGVVAALLGSTPAGTAAEGTVVSATASSVTLQANAGGLPAHLGVVTTGGPQVQGTLPLASGARIVVAGDGNAAATTSPTLSAGEHIRVWIDNGQVTAILVQSPADAQGGR